MAGTRLYSESGNPSGVRSSVPSPKKMPPRRGLVGDRVARPGPKQEAAVVEVPEQRSLFWSRLWRIHGANEDVHSVRALSRC